MDSLFLLLAFIGTAFCKLNQTFDELFAVYTEPSCQFFGCAEDLTHPVNGLKWSNVHSVHEVTPVDFLHPGGQLPPYADPEAESGIGSPLGLWTGRFINGTIPAVATSHYNGSCVKHWTLHSLALGCNINTVYDDDPTQYYTGPADCNITVEGFDRHGVCVGHESYTYHGEVINVGFPPYWLEQTYNTTRGGLRGKSLRKVSISAEIPFDPVTQSGPEVGIGRFQYTVYNSTKCSGHGANSTARV